MYQQGFSFTLADLQDITDQLSKLNFKILDSSQMQQGSFGSVIFVQDIISSQKYALKIQKLVDNNGEYSLNQQKFCENESGILKKLQSERVVKLWSAFKIENKYFVIQMSMIEYSLDQYVELKKIDEETFIKIALQILEGIEFAHKQNYIIRDLKPDNILVDGAGNIYLCDFGLAKSSIDIQKQNDVSAILSNQFPKGSLGFFPPEIIKVFMEVDKQSDQNQIKIQQTKEGDIWAFGLILSYLRGLTLMQISLLISSQEYHQAINRLELNKNEKKLIRYILNIDPKQRPTPLQIKEKMSYLFNLSEKQIKVEYIYQDPQIKQYYQSLISSQPDINNNFYYKNGIISQKIEDEQKPTKQFQLLNKQNNYQIQYDSPNYKQIQQDQLTNNTSQSQQQLIKQQQNNNESIYYGNDYLNNDDLMYGFEDFVFQYENIKDIVIFLLQSFAQIINLSFLLVLKYEGSQKIFCGVQMIIYLCYSILKLVKHQYLINGKIKDNISELWNKYYILEGFIDIINLVSLVLIQNEYIYYFSSIFVTICLHIYSKYNCEDYKTFHSLMIVFLLPELCFFLISEPYGKIIFYKGLAFILIFKTFALLSKDLTYEYFSHFRNFLTLSSYILSFVIFKDECDKILYYYIEFIVYTLIPLGILFIIFSKKKDYDSFDLIILALNFWITEKTSFFIFVSIQFYMSIILIIFKIFRKKDSEGLNILYLFVQSLMIILTGCLIIDQLTNHYNYSAIFNSICLIFRLLFIYQNQT